MSKIKNIIFDLDGTLWDSRCQIIKAWKNVIPNIDITSTQLTNLMGKTAIEYLDLLFPNCNEEQANYYMSQCEQEEIAHLSKNGAFLYNNVIETIKLLSNIYNLFIVSNCQSGYIESFFKHYNLSNLFSDIECNGKTNKLKPENIKILMTRNNLDANETCYIGDTQGDYDAAIQNNITFIWAKYGFGKNLNCNFFINKPSEIFDLIKSFG